MKINNTIALASALMLLSGSVFAASTEMSASQMVQTYCEACCLTECVSIVSDSTDSIVIKEGESLLKNASETIASKGTNFSLDNTDPKNEGVIIHIDGTYLATYSVAFDVKTTDLINVGLELNDEVVNGGQAFYQTEELLETNQLLQSTVVFDASANDVLRLINHSAREMTLSEKLGSDSVRLYLQRLK